MKRKISFVLFMLVCFATFAQTVTLTFTAKDAANHHVQLNRVAITNLTKSWQEIIYWPDTTLTMQNGTGIDESVTNDDFALSQNNPNPFSITTDVNLTMEEVGAVMMEISDVNGRVVETQNFASLQPGIHQFRVSLSAAGTYVMTARQNRKTSSIKMVCNGGGSSNTINYLGIVHTITYVLKSNTTNPFNFGDIMEYVGYATINGAGAESQHITQAQRTSQTFTLHFDVTQYFAPSVTTSSVSDIRSTIATCGGNITSDGGANVTSRGVCWSTSQNPTINNSHTTDGSGTGCFTSSLAGLTAGTLYYVRAYATNSVGTAYGSQESFTTTVNDDGQPCLNATTVTDYEGNTYNTVQIGDQCWIKENLKTTRYANGEGISFSGVPYQYDGHYYYPNNNISNVSTYGYLYNSEAVMHNSPSSNANPSGVQGICPTGWHVPSDAEWIQLTDYLSSQSQYVCGNTNTNIAKALAATIGWYVSSSSNCCNPVCNPSENNATGFSALPAGCRKYVNYSYSYCFGDMAVFWSTSGSYKTQIRYDYPSTMRITSDSPSSVRCLRNGGISSAIQLPTVTTSIVFDFTSNSASIGGSVSSDGGATITARGVCWSTTPTPTMGSSHTTNGNSMGGFISDLTGLAANTTYYVRAYASNSAGTAYGNEICFTTLPYGATDGQPCPGAASMTDIDNNIYNTVQIGLQCWMKENLKTTRYANGEIIALGSSSSTTTGYRYYPNNYSSNVSSYGYLYNWKAVMNNSTSSQTNPSGVQGICPTGWHVPSVSEWTQLTNYVNGKGQYLCSYQHPYTAKALASTTGWSFSNNYSSADWPCVVGSNPNTNNATGFSALPAGYNYSGYSGNFEFAANFWLATLYNDNNAYSGSIKSENAYVDNSNSRIEYGYSVRCLRDESASPAPQLPSVTTSSVSNITQTSATCGGNVTSDGGAIVTARGVCWSTTHNPTISNDHTTDGNGTGIFTSSHTGLTAGTTYYVRAYATNIAGTTYGNEVCFNTLSGLPCPGTPTLIDADGNIYNTVQIGSQCWMKENLRTTKYASGTSVALGSVANTSETIAYRYYPNNDPSNVASYGYLYNWPAATGNNSEGTVQGICPIGWHVPNQGEWTELLNHVSGQEMYVCGNVNMYIAKALASTTGWNSNSQSTCSPGYNYSDNNATGFSALPAGCMGSNSWFGDFAYFWTSSASLCPDGGGLYCAYNRVLHYNVPIVSGGAGHSKSEAYSVRCLKN